MGRRIELGPGHHGPRGRERRCDGGAASLADDVAALNRSLDRTKGSIVLVGHDPFFVPPGAEAFKRDNPKAVVRFFDTGHFAQETHASEIAESIREFLT